MIDPRGDFIDGTFHAPTGDAFRSYDPTQDEAVVLETAGSPERVAMACAAAAAAQPAWADRPRAERVAILHDFRDAIREDGDGLAEAIRLEMGKVASEAQTEVNALIGRFALVEKQLLDVTDRPGHGEALRYRPHGVVGVLGPFNFPLHLCNAHVLPALALGNTVVMKPSEVTPLAGERYAACAKKAGLPPGVFNVVQGGGAVGAAVVQDPRVRALAFTGSWPTGRRILEASLDRPEMLLALEMGGKNMCVVLDDADLRQAAHEIITSGYLTTGQRCTGSDRVLVAESVADRLIEAVRAIVENLRLDDPTDPASFAGPLANRASKERYLAMVKKGEAGGAAPIVSGDADRPGAYVGPSLHRLEKGSAEIEGYTDHELFGPDLCVQVVADDDEAIAILSRSEYGFAHSVFTQDRDRYARFERAVSTGILNLNRSTNRASPRLPFGGVKKSGNFRPAGAWASRNLVYPQAQLHNEAGVFDRHPLITPHLVSPDLDALEARHGVEECEEVGRSLIDTPRPEATRLPEGGALPSSGRWLDRFHAGDRFVTGEKKPLVFDHLRSRGPWMVSVDEPPLSVIDAMSQTATLPAGFAPDAAVRAYVEGGFGDALVLNRDTTLGDDPAVQAYAETLRALAPGLSTVTFANSGAEANEKAYALCMREAKPEQKKLLAFEGSFHGRTLLALYASHNPVKRAPFEIEGYEVDFLAAPLLETGTHADAETVDPDGWREVWAAADAEAAKARWGDGEDLALKGEVAALAAVVETLKASEHFAVVIEPMQSEGGDRYVSPRFHRALRLVTRALGTSLIVDEVQCGNGLSGPFLWHQQFGYVDASGAPDRPDCVCFAKRAQLGVVLSRYEDPEPTATFVPSLIRGRIHAESIGDGADAHRIEALVRPQLEALGARWGHRIENPRAEGYALAFELRSPAELGAYLGQRFFRGVVVFGAGTRTVRYRLNASFDARTVALLFNSIQRSLAWLEAHPGKKPPAWEDFDETLVAPPADDGGVTLRQAEASEADALIPRIMEIEARAYEPARRDSEPHLRKGFSEHGVAVVAELDGEVIGSALGAPIELFADVEGIDRDPMLGRDNTMYCIAVTVDPDHHGKGVGRRLKTELLRAARDGGRYAHASGRNRVPDAASMTRLNDSLGAYTVALLDEQYEGGGVARYYRQPLGAFKPAPLPERRGETVDLASGLARPFAEPPRSLVSLHDAGGLYGPAVTKVTVLNYVTPAAVRATEWLGAIAPDHPHLYLCSSRDEATDKAVRSLRYHREAGDTVIGFEGGYVGHTTACARSISDPSTHAQGAPYFDWPRVPHPADGVDASIDAIRAIIDARGADRVLGLMLEPVQERTGRVLDAAFYERLEALRSETGVPVAFAETACAYYRSGHGPFASSGAGFVPDLLAWWTGGHLGVLHATTRYRVDKPFVLVSTWDGDELSLIQAQHQLRAARRVDVAAGAAALDAALEGVDASGLGLYRVIHAAGGADALADKLAGAKIRVRRHPGGHLAVIARLDRAVQDAEALGAALG